MNQKEIDTVYSLLIQRVQPESALEGVAIFNLASKAKEFMSRAANPVPPLPPVADASGK